MRQSQILESSEENILNFKVENANQAIAACYALLKHQLTLDVMEKHSGQFYQAVLRDKDLPEELAVYSNIKNLYKYLSQCPERAISYSNIGKHLIVFDRIGKKIKYSKIQLYKRHLSEDEMQQIGLYKLKEEREGLISEMDRLKSQLQKANQKQAQHRMAQSALQKERKHLLIRIDKQEEAIQLLKRQSKVLKQKYGIYHHSEQQEEILFDNLKKIRQHASQDYTDRKMVDQKRFGKLSSEDASNIAEDRPNGSAISGEITTSKATILSQSQNDVIYYGKKMNYFIEEQANQHQFNCVDSIIRKISDSSRRRLLFLMSQHKIYHQTHQNPRVFLDFKNITDSHITSSPDFYIIVGILSSRSTSILSVGQGSQAIFLHTSKSILDLFGAEVPTLNKVHIASQDIIRLVIDYDLRLMAWFLNEELVGQAVIDSGLIRQGFHPFVELRAKNSAIQLI